MVNQNLAQVSDILVGSAMVVYTGALLAYATDLGNLGVHRPSAARRDAADAKQRVLVGAGGGKERDVVVDLRDDVEPPTLAEDSPSGDQSEPAPTRRRAAGIGVSMTWLAFLFHFGSVLTRGLAAGRVPWGNMYEFGLTGSCVVTGVFLGAVLRNRAFRVLGAFAVGPVLLTLGACTLLFYTVAARLVPALQSGFLLIHVSVAFVSTALFTLAFSAHILQLIQERRERGDGDGFLQRRGAFMERLPTSEHLEQIGYRLTVISFPLWTFTLVAGAIWAEKAWNRYWGWDPKEVWTFVVWVVYAAYLHARVTRGWSGAKCTMIAIVGFICVIVNYAIVNVFFTGQHSYAGIG